MAGITLEKGKTVYTYGQPMTALHLITSGKILVSYPGGSYQIGKGDVVGICEVCSEVHLLNYTTLEETSFLTYPLNNLDTLSDLLQKHPDVARLFLLSIFRQISILQNRYAISEMHCSSLHGILMEDYQTYCNICSNYRINPRKPEGLDEQEAYLNDETPDLWVNGYYLGLRNIYASDNYKTFVAESSVSLGMIRKGSLDFRKTIQSLEEQYIYQNQIYKLYFRESEDDLYDCYTSLYFKLDRSSQDAAQLLSIIERIGQQTEESGILNTELLSSRIGTFKSNLAHLGTAEVATPVAEDVLDPDILAELNDSLTTILDFASPEPELATSFRKHVAAYKAMSDPSSLEDTAIRLRKKITAEFHTIYSLAFKNTLESMLIPAPVMMFLYFGYVDEELAGLSNAVTLYQLSKTIVDHSDAGVYTFYDWLCAIYNGRKDPSRNEFDEDYADYIHKKKFSDRLSDAEFRAMEQDRMAKVDYELENMFRTVNKITFGRLTTYCPLFTADNVLKDLTTSYVTASQIGQIIRQIKSIDYSAFYRESLDLQNSKLMGKETIHLEFLPDIILMPNVGIRGSMWQEIEGKRRNSPGRMIFSIFHLEDLKTTFVRLTGEFRWELCKRVQGNRWNDISERSLTSEYFDYVQFYRKNHDLSPEAKEKVRTGLQRAKNSFKEMFVRDYIVWVLFEGNSSPRLNKVARKILFAHCPFPEDICHVLEQNPLYTELLQRRRVLVAQRLHHLDMLRKKILNNGAKIPETLVNEFDYVKGVVQ